MDDDVALHRRAARLEADRLVREVLARTPSAMGWGQSMLAGGTQAWPQAARALASGRCKVGLVSADFRTHATGMLLVQTLENLDRSRFELTLYSHGADDSTPLRQRLVAAADHFVDCTHLTLAAQAGRTRDDGTVILIDMSGYTTGSRLQLFALRHPHRRPACSRPCANRLPSAAWRPRGWCLRPLSRPPSTWPGCPWPMCFSTPFRMARTPPAAMRCGWACRCSPKLAAASPRAWRPACSTPWACPSWQWTTRQITKKWPCA